MDSYLTFKIGKEAFAANIKSVIEIINVPEITELPNSDAHVLGVINHRGKVLVVIDAKVKFNIQSNLKKDNPCIIILETMIGDKNHEMGIMVDIADSVLELSENEILPPPNIGASIKEDMISGVINRNNEFIMILNIDNVFTKEFKIK